MHKPAATGLLCMYSSFCLKTSWFHNETLKGFRSHTWYFSGQMLLLKTFQALQDGCFEEELLPLEYGSSKIIRVML